MSSRATDTVRRLVRQEYKYISDEEFAESYDVLYGALGAEKQLEIVEKAWEIAHQPPPMPLSFKKLPLDVLAMMMADVNISTLQAWCQTETFVRDNCPKLVDKIMAQKGQLKEWREFKAAHPDFDFKRHAIEAMVAMEIGSMFYDKSKIIEGIYSAPNVIFRPRQNFPSMEVQVIWVTDWENIEFRNDFGKKNPSEFNSKLDTLIDGHLNSNQDLYIRHQNNRRKFENIVYKLQTELDLVIHIAEIHIIDNISNRGETIHFPHLSCSVCGRSSGQMFRCSPRCGTVYCGERCADKDWAGGHSKNCDSL